MKAGIAGVGSEACKACDAPVVQLAKLGQAGDQDGGERRADAGNRGEAALAL